MTVRTRLQQIDVATALITEECLTCHTIFAMSRELYDQRRRDKKDFYCPQGHSMMYKGLTWEAELAAAKDEAAFLSRRLTAERNALDATRRQLSATKGVVTRTRKRIANGVCPCYHRSFVSLARHMATQHPGYVDELVDDATVAPAE